MAKYSETLTEHVMAPRNGATIDDLDRTGHTGAPGRRAFMTLYLKVQDERITTAFRSHTRSIGPFLWRCPQ